VIVYNLNIETDFKKFKISFSPAHRPTLFRNLVSKEI